MHARAEAKRPNSVSEKIILIVIILVLIVVIFCFDFHAVVTPSSEYTYHGDGLEKWVITPTVLLVFYCRSSTFVHSVFVRVLYWVSFRVLQPFSGTLGGMPSGTVTFVVYSNINCYRRSPYYFNYEHC